VNYDVREALLRFLLWNVKIIDPVERKAAIREARARKMRQGTKALGPGIPGLPQMPRPPRQ
jgi:hypothetical protein